MGAGLTVRFAPARSEDWSAMRSLVNQAFTPYVERLGKPPAPMVADWRAIARAGTATLAWMGEELVGLIVVIPEIDGVLVDDVAVALSVQGHGLGTRLLARAEQIARENGTPRVRLYTNEAMTENLPYYARRGFAETGRRVEEGYLRVYFEKKLEPLT